MELTGNDLIRIRRQFHQIPELALHETKTHELLLRVIQSFNHQYLTIREIPALPTALLVRVQGKEPHRIIGYRADIDALPVTEETELPFASRFPGRMHACGHDFHMTVALGILSYFSEHQPQDDLVFFFQPAEEQDFGGKRAFDLDVFTGKWRPTEFYGLHVNPELPAGAIGCRRGTLFAGTTEFDLTLHGKQGHAAFPHRANDMVVAMAAFIMQAQTIVARNIDPLKSGVVTIGSATAGTIRNVIAGTAHVAGTIRGLTQETILQIKRRLQAISAGIATSFDCTADLAMRQGGYLPVINNNQLTGRFINYMKENPKINFIPTPPAMTGEDFGFLLSKFPGTMFWLGVGTDAALHSATFTPNEAALSAGVSAMVNFLNARMEDD